MSEVRLVAPALTLQREQEIPSAPDAAALVLVDDVDEQEGQHPDVPVRQLGSNDVEHAMEGVKAVGVVRRLLGPGLEAPVFSGRATVRVGAGGGVSVGCLLAAAAAPPARQRPGLHGPATSPPRA